MKSESPVVKFCGVDQLGPEVFQQGPVRAVWLSFGPSGEDESDGLAVSDAHVAVGPIGHVLHQPLHAPHGEVVDMESCP